MPRPVSCRWISGTLRNWLMAAWQAEQGMIGREPAGMLPEGEDRIAGIIFDGSLMAIHNGAESREYLLDERVDHRRISISGKRAEKPRTSATRLVMQTADGLIAVCSIQFSSSCRAASCGQDKRIDASPRVMRSPSSMPVWRIPAPCVHR